MLLLQTEALNKTNADVSRGLMSFDDHHLENIFLDIRVSHSILQGNFLDHLFRDNLTRYQLNDFGKRHVTSKKEVILFDGSDSNDYPPLRDPFSGPKEPIRAEAEGEVIFPSSATSTPSLNTFLIRNRER